jgi:hypothetical protein
MNPAAVHLVHRRGSPCRRQRGALTVMAGLLLVVLAGMLALVLDLAHLFIVKSELQNAADACALSAAAELASVDPDPSVMLARATAAGTAVGAANKIELQGAPTDIAPNDITIATAYGGPYTRIPDPKDYLKYKYARCTPQATNLHSVVMWLATAFRLTTDPISIDSAVVGAEAVAKVITKVDTCALPLAVCTINSAGSNLGFTIGDWTTGLRDPKDPTNKQTGQYGWLDFKDLLNASLADIVAGAGECNLPNAVTTIDSKNGLTAGVDKAWNTRFGLYAGNYNNATLYKTDTTGFAYTKVSWPSRKLAFSDQYPKNYQSQEAVNAPYDPSAIVDKNGNPVNFSGNPSPAPNLVYAAGTPGRRIAVMPVVSCNSWDAPGNDNEVLGWVCGLMLAPISGPTDVQIEVISVTKAPDQRPCNSIPGLGGDAIQKLVR